MTATRFTDNGNGAITDTQSGLTWTQKDSRQMTGKWMDLEKAKKFALEMNAAKFGGFDDWRVPKLEDVKTIFDPSFSLKTHGNDTIHLPPVFASGGADNTWTDTVNGGRAMLFNLIKGRSNWINKLGEGPFAVRLVRGSIAATGA